uniref:Uncharacterized protein n=1 Tax=Astyanax mexicanus TaxID=7994 RepID=A0A8B9H042_ASTMX
MASFMRILISTCKKQDTGSRWFRMSNTSPTAAVSTPPVPRFCSLRLSRILLKRGSSLVSGCELRLSGRCPGWTGR